jgi:hypothetical protein
VSWWHSLPGTFRMRTSTGAGPAVYRENGSTQDLHVLIAAQKMLHSALSGIGFDPAVGPGSAWPRYGALRRLKT